MKQKSRRMNFRWANYLRGRFPFNMAGLLILISVFPSFIFGQATLSAEEQTKAYCQVIAEYIKVADKNNSFRFDTLYIGKHEEFPPLKLPGVIQCKKIILLTYKAGDKEPQNKKSFVLINIIELKVTKEKAKFMLVTFHRDYHPQHNCYINLNYDPAGKVFERDGNIRFEYNYPKRE